MELRYGGVDILADPGTYCYHGEPAWRSYFRSTIGHNTVELDGQSQSAEGGPFLWLRHAQARETEVLDTGGTAAWTAEHDGYLSLDPPARHRRRVRLDRTAGTVEITDEVDQAHDLRLAFHLGPEVEAELDGTSGAAALAGRGHAGHGRAGAAGRAAVEPAPRRGGPHPGLVLRWPGSPRARDHAPR